MSLAAELLRQVSEAKKQKAQDEMGVPSYDNLNTPNNHVGNSSNATQERKVSGLGDRKVKHPTANIGDPHKEKGRDMEGVKGVKVSESAVRDLGIDVGGGFLTFHHPGNPEQQYRLEMTPKLKQFFMGAMQRTGGDSSAMFDLLQDYYEQGAGQDPRAMNPEAPEMMTRQGLAAGKGDWPLSEAPFAANNPIVQALGMELVDGVLTMTSPDGKAALQVPMSGSLSKALNSFITNPDARRDTGAAAARLFQLVGQKAPGAKAVQPGAAGARSTQSAVKSKGVSPDAGSGLSLAPMDEPAAAPPKVGMAVNPRQRVAAGVGESAHKAAHGEMSHPTVSRGNPAKSASVRGKQNDEPTNKGNPGTSHEEKGQKKPQFTMTPKHTKGATRGDNENKSMKKMHETVQSLESLLGRKLDLGFQTPEGGKLVTEAGDPASEMLPDYIGTALWASHDESDPETGGDPMDDNYSAADIAPDTVQKMQRDLERFVQAAGDFLAQAVREQSLGHVAHDFWLTRNGHGAGFWDGDYSKPVGDALTELSRKFGEVTLYVGDDGMIHQDRA